MTKTRKSTTNDASTKKRSNSVKQRKVQWSILLKRLAIFLVISAVLISSFIIYLNNQKEQQDLSVIGNGKATVVQIHNPSCRLCRQLKGNLDAVKGDFVNHVQFKTTMIVKQEGRAFADHHGVEHITLLFFDKQGKRVNTIEGVSSKTEIKNALESLVNK